MNRSAAASSDNLPLLDIDRVIDALDNALRTLFAPAQSGRPLPGQALSDDGLGDSQRRLSARLMRVNHNGEVSAQALYQGQLTVARGREVKSLLTRAAREETEHLAWTERRLAELGGRKSLFGPLWYAVSFAMGVASGSLGDRWNLGFLAETERQVESHLESHLRQLPGADLRSRAVLEQMKNDEAGHAVAAQRAGASELSAPMRTAMRFTSKLMTLSSLWV
jgi:ubiquinone biosynthesis monooxygenase Coq7